MNLTTAHIAQFDEQGYLFFPDLLDSDEVAVLQQALPDILSRPGPEIIPEKDDPSSVRLAFGAHTSSEPFRCLTLLPRLLNPVRQLLRGCERMAQVAAVDRRGLYASQSQCELPRLHSSALRQRHVPVPLDAALQVPHRLAVPHQPPNAQALPLCTLATPLRLPDARAVLRPATILLCEPSALRYPPAMENRDHPVPIQRCGLPGAHGPYYSPKQSVSEIPSIGYELFLHF